MRKLQRRKTVSAHILALFVVFLSFSMVQDPFFYRFPSVVKRPAVALLGSVNSVCVNVVCVEGR